MYREIVVSLAIALLVSSAAFAGYIDQGQSFFGNPNDVLYFNGGIGSGNYLLTAQTVPMMTQTANKNDAWAVQHQYDYLAASGNASELVSTVSVSGSLAGGNLTAFPNNQFQVINDGGGTKIQGSYLGVVSRQDLLTVNGPAWGQATNTAILSQNQQAGNAVGNTSESSGIVAGQSGFISGTPGTVGTLNGGMTVMATQSQVVN